MDPVLLVLGGGGTAPSAAEDSWDCCGELESPRPGAAAVGASGGCSGAACSGMSVAVGDPHSLRQLHPVVVAPALVHLVQTGAEVLLVCLHLVLHLVLEAHPCCSAAAAAAVVASVVASAAAGALQLPGTWSWGNPAVDPSVLPHPEVLLAAAGGPLHLHLQPEVVKRGVSLVVPDLAA